MRNFLSSLKKVAYKQFGMNGTLRKDIKVGYLVEIVEKQNQRSDDRTEGYIARILTKSPQHPHGIKVRLETGEVGRVKAILSTEID
jgi:uncharacterized repeat protein (TIGR03833 family)